MNPTTTSPIVFRKWIVAAFALLFALEIGWGLWDWRQGNHDDFGAMALHSVAILAFLWFFLLIVAERSSRLLAWLQSKAPGVAFGARLLLTGFVILLWNLLIFSVGLRFSLGTYLNLFLLRFTAVNLTHGLWEHMAMPQRIALAGGAGFALVSTIWISRQIWRAAPHLSIFVNPQRRRGMLVAFLALTVGFSLSSTALNNESRPTRKAKMLAHISFRLDPFLTFGLSCWDLCKQQRIETKELDELNLVPRSTALATGPLANKPNIIFLQIESFRADNIGLVYQGIEVTPNINCLARLGTRFSRGFAPATHTSLSNISIPSSLYPLRDESLTAYRSDDPCPRTMIYDLLKPNGYTTAWISSDFESWSGMVYAIDTPSLDKFFDSGSRELELHPELARNNHISIKLAPDVVTMSNALCWIEGNLQAGRPFYATISLSDSHFPYASSITNATWFQPSGIPPEYTFNGYPREKKEQVRNTYLNSIHGVDLLIGKMLDVLRAHNALDDTIIVVYGDHGESFYENDLPTHANLPFTPSINTGLVMFGTKYFPAKTEDYPTSLIDMVPTVLARIGLPPHPNFQGIDVLSENRPPIESRCLYLRVDCNINADGLIAGGRIKYFEDNLKGDSYLFDLAKDPLESRNLVESEPQLAQWMAAQLNRYRAIQMAYYHFPKYHDRFYPPSPPLLMPMPAPSR